MSRARSKSRNTPLADRCVTFLVDGIIAGAISWILGLGCIYWIIRDGIRDGRSIGKGMMNFRVVQHGTRRGATGTNFMPPQLLQFLCLSAVYN